MPAGAHPLPPPATVHDLCATGADFHRRGWSLGTSSNYSLVLGRDPLELLVTVSGKDKGRLAPGDFVRVGPGGRPVQGGDQESSAETMLHVVIANHLPGAGAILHTHSVWGTVLSRRAGGAVTLAGYEMLKGLAGNGTHDMSETVRVFDNSQDIPAMAAEVGPWLASTQPPPHGFLIRGHGLYTWGSTLADARRHVEVLEFLFECEARAAASTAGA